MRQLGASNRSLAVAAVVIILLAGLALTPAVSAHAVLSDTDPGQGAHVEEVPETITLTYTGDGVDDVIEMSVTGPSGEDVTEDVYRDGDISEQVFIDIADAGDGVYVVEWEVRATDTHITQGTWFFTVGEDGLNPAEIREALDEEGSGADTSPEYAQILPMGLLYLSTTALIGMSIALLWCLRPVSRRFDVPTEVADATTGRVLLAAALGVAISTVMLLLEAAISSGRTVGALGDVLGSRNGIILLSQFAIGGALTGVLYVGLRPGWFENRLSVSVPSWFENVPGEYIERFWPIIAAFGGVLVVVGFGATSHTAGQVGLLAGTVATLGHLVGAAAWVGGLFVLATVLPAVLEAAEKPDRHRLAASVIRRFSLLAIGGVTLLVSTGLGLTAWLVPSLAAFSETLHGTTLGVKLLLVVAALGLGARTRFLLLQRLDASTAARDPLLRRLSGLAREKALGNRGRTDGGNPTAAVGDVIRTVRVETAIVVCVLLVSGLLTAAVPGIVAGLDGADDHGAVDVDVDAETVDAELTLLPASETDDGFEVSDGSPVVVELTMHSGGEPVELETTERVFADHAETGTTIDPELEALDEPGTYGAVLLLPETGEWTLRLNVWTGEELLDEEFPLDNVPDEVMHESHDEHDGHDHDEHGSIEASDDETSAFALALWFAAIAVGLIGSAGLTLETARFRQRTPTSGRPDTQQSAVESLAGPAQPLRESLRSKLKTPGGQRHTTSYDATSLVSLAETLEAGSRVELAGRNRERSEPLAVVESTTTEWQAQNGTRQFTTATVRLTDGETEHTVSLSSDPESLPTWHNGVDETPLTVFQIADSANQSV